MAEPHYRIHTQSVADAKSELRRLIDDWLARALKGDGTAPQVGIKGAAGLGKTEDIMDALAGLPNLRNLNVEVYAPRHDLNGEWMDRFKQKRPDVNARIIKGRAQPEDGADGCMMCRKSELARKVFRMGLSVETTLCRNDDEDMCEFHPFARAPALASDHRRVLGSDDGCPYQLQFLHTKDEKAIRIMPHDYLHLPRGHLPKPDLVIVDESFWRTLTAYSSFGLDQLTKAPDDLPSEDQERLFKMAQVVHVALVAGAPIKRALKGAGYTRADVGWAAKVEKNAAPALSISPGMDSVTQLEALRGFKPGNSRLRGIMWSLIHEEWEQRGDKIMRVELRKDRPMPGGPRDMVFLHFRRKPVRLSGVPVLIIDASLDEQIAGVFLPDLEFHQIAVERNAEIIQCSDRSGSLHRLSEPNRIREIQALVAWEQYQGRRVLLVSTKKLAGKGKLQPLPPTNLAGGRELAKTVDQTWFGNFTGIDRWKEFDTVIVVGREEPPVREVEGHARALFWDRGKPLRLIAPTVSYTDQEGNHHKGGRFFYAKRVRRVRMRDGRAPSVEMSVHPDPDCQRVLEQVREEATTQAMDRLRLVHNDRTKSVIILSNVVADVTVDLQLPWNEIIPNRFQRALTQSGGVLPLSATELARVFPKLWRTVEAARASLKALNGVGSVIGLLLQRSPYLIRAKYRRRGKPGKPTQMLLDKRLPAPRGCAETVVGPMSEFSCTQPRPRIERRLVAADQTRCGRGPVCVVVVLSASRIHGGRVAALRDAGLTIFPYGADPHLPQVRNRA